MKLKQDFITNSSTTCFVAWGLSYNCYDFTKENTEKMKVLYEKKYNEPMPEEFSSTAVELLLENTGLEYSIFYDGDWVGIGMPFTRMKDEETFREFKERVKEELQKIGITDTPVYIEEAWRDG